MKISPADPEILRLRANKSATTQNWLPWQHPLRNWKKWTGLTTFTQIPTIWWKNRENGYSRCWYSFAQLKKNRKKLTQAKYIARSTGLPSGLKKDQKIFWGRKHRPHPWWAKPHVPAAPQTRCLQCLVSPQVKSWLRAYLVLWDRGISI